ncbi:MAG: TrkA family potassium uptake protein [Chloroflexi bacterium]|nr:TrkA family potassium uptake protein [Chloroflexota bacterium]
MKIVIVGCGRVGGSAAETWDAAGHEVIVLDISATAFERLPASFGGTAIRGDGTDEDVLRRSGAEGADVFLAMTEGDNRNVMSAQLATEVFDVGNVIAKINDPLRAEAYAELGIATVCRTGLMLEAVNGYLGFPKSGLASMLAPTGTHPGGGHHSVTAGSAAAGAAGPSAGASARASVEG